MGGRTCKLRKTAGGILAGVAGLLLQAPVAVAAGNWRPTYDTVMMWVNFFILVALWVKLLRHPLRNFLTTQRDAVKDTLESLEKEKHRIETEIQALRVSLEERQQRAADLHERMVAQGEEERREIVAEAEVEAQRRLLKARQMIEARHREACRRLRNEMVDSAIHRALEELPQHMTPEVEKSLTERFLKTISPLPK